MSGKVDLAEKINAVGGFWSPGIVGHINDWKVAVVGVQGAFVWQMHDNTDEFFLVLHGQPTIQRRDRDVELSEGEMFVVPPESSTAQRRTARRRCGRSSRGEPSTPVTQAAISLRRA